jgi:zinc transport system substrate-binding protein
MLVREMNTNRALRVGTTVVLIVIAASAGYAIGSMTTGSSSSLAGNAFSSSSGAGLRVLATFLPVYDDAIDLLGDKGSVTLLVPFSVNVHKFQPTPSSIQLVQQADVLVYNGAGLEPWIPQLVAAAGNSKLIQVNASEGLPLILVPSEYQKDNRTIDPHVWNDPVLAQMQVKNILQGLIKADPGDAAYFTANANALIAKFQFMDQELRTGTANVATRTFVSFHEAFGYLAKEYNLIEVSLAGPFEEEPTPSDIYKAVAAINQNHLCVCFAESLENPAPIEAVAAQTHAHVWILDPIGGLSAADSNAGVTYLVLMQQNIYTLLQALNQADC